MSTQLETFYSVSKKFTITEQEYEDFCKHHLFDQLKGKPLGEAFCEKYNETNYVLKLLSDESASQHIRKFYVE